MTQERAPGPRVARQEARLRGVRKQYHFWRGDNGLDAWDVDHLIELTKDFPVREVAISSIDDVDTEYWFGHGTERPTVRAVLDHLRLVQQVDPSYPVILGVDGRVMDGMHRIARAMLDGRSSILAVQFETALEPDYRACTPEDLPY
jgi:hypothetical protein